MYVWPKAWLHKPDSLRPPLKWIKKTTTDKEMVEGPKDYKLGSTCLPQTQVF